MSNKTQLQLNNETLASILSNVLGLPSQESLKHGAYVWKKYECISVENPSFLLTKKSGSASYQISDASFDFSAISEDKYAEFFDGFSGENSSFANSSGAVEITAKWSDGYTYSKVYSYEDFDSSTGTFNNASSASQTFSEMVYFTGTKQTGAKTFVDCVVSDDPTAYPDGGEQGGYWYELFDLKSFGIDFGEVTLASKATFVTVSHNLGVVPSWVALIPKSLATTSSSSLFNINGKAAYSALSSNPLIRVESAANTLSAEEITFATRSNPFAATGYYWFALA